MSEINLITLIVGELEVNCYILWDSSTKEAVIIDPGGDAEDIINAVRDNRLTVKFILCTHGHFDHVGAVGAVKDAVGGVTAVHKKDARLMLDAHEHAVIFGVKTAPQPEPERLLEEGGFIKAGAITLEVIHTPGHTEGGVSFFERNKRLLFTGDTLFAGSIGRTDFEGGSIEEIMSSIRKKLLPLGEDVRVLPGHGGETTIGAEKRYNPFIASAFAQGEP